MARILHEECWASYGIPPEGTYCLLSCCWWRPVLIEYRWVRPDPHTGNSLPAFWLMVSLILFGATISYFIRNNYRIVTFCYPIYFHQPECFCKKELSNINEGFQLYWNIVCIGTVFTTRLYTKSSFLLLVTFQYKELVPGSLPVISSGLGLFWVKGVFFSRFSFVFLYDDYEHTDFLAVQWLSSEAFFFFNVCIILSLANGGPFELAPVT